MTAGNEKLPDLSLRQWAVAIATGLVAALIVGLLLRAIGASDLVVYAVVAVLCVVGSSLVKRYALRHGSRRES